MSKQYRQEVWASIFCLVGILLGFYMFIDTMQRHNYSLSLLALAGLPFVIYIFTITLFFQINLLEDSITITAKRLRKPQSLGWDEIGWVVDDHWIGLHVYHLVPNSYGKQRITIPAGVKNKEDLLKEIIRRAPQAKIEESIKQLVAKR